MFGFRPEGRRVKEMDPIVRMMPYIMPMRCDAQVFLKHRADLETLFDYTRRQKLDKGELPQCVAQCGGRARWFGDLEKGLGTFEAPGYTGGGKDYDTLQKTRFTLAGQTGKQNTVAIEPFTDNDVYKLPDVGNGPSFRYILRNRKWHG